MEFVQNPEMQEEREDTKSPETISKKSSKKRKRERKHDGEEEKREEIHATIKYITAQPDKVPPVVAYFSSGYNPVVETQRNQETCNNGVNDQSPNKNLEAPRVKIYRNKVEKKSNRLQVVVSPPGSKVEFVGSNFAGEGATRQVCVYTLGVLDKETNTLKIVPIASNKIIRLEPRVGGLDYDKEPSSVSVKTELSAEQRADRMRELTNLYGTKKSISQAKKRRALNQGDDPESQKILDSKIKEVEINMEALESSNALIARNIPPYDSSATDPKDAYPLDKIILNGEWAYLEDIYKLLQIGREVATDSCPAFIRNRIYKLHDIKDETEKKTRACIFSFIGHLVKFKDLYSLDGFSSAKDHKIPNILRNRFSSVFSEAGSKRLPVDKINLLISYVLVLTLHVDEFRTDPSDIAKDLRMSPITLRSHFENLGCKFSREKSLLFATLPVPLKFPSVRQRRRR